MSLCLIAFCLGVAVLLLRSQLLALGWCCGVLAASILLCCVLLAKVNRAFILKTLVVLWVAFCAGFTWANWRAHQMLIWHVPVQHINKPIQIQGRIISLPKTTQFSVRFKFRTNKIAGHLHAVTVYLSWYGKYPVLSVGDRWQLTVKLKPPHTLRNPGTFDYQRWLFVQGIRATGAVVSKRPQRLLQHAIWRFPITHLRQKIQTVIQHSVAHAPLAAILNTLTTGARSLMSVAQWRVFQNTGTSHLMAISGLHVGLIASMVYFLVRVLWSFCPWLLLRIPAPRAAAVAALAAAIIYGLLAGFSLPTERAVIMIAALMLGSLFYQSVPVWRRLLLAFFIIVVWQPFVLWSASFWLSFAAVSLIGYAMGGRVGALRGLKANTRLQCVIFIGLLPLTLYFFQQISLVALIANVVAIPWVGMVIVPLCFFATLLSLFSVKLAHVLFWLAAKLLTPLWWWLQWLARWPHAVWYYAIAPAWLLIPFIMATLLLLAPSGWPGRWLGLVWALPLFWGKVAVPSKNSVWLTLLDVGQGLAAVVQTAHHVLLFDAGPRSYTGFDAGQRVVVPYLATRHIKHIDVMMISHGDNDHIGGAKAVLARMQVDRVVTSVVRRFATRAIYCHAGQQWRWDGVAFQVLAPPVGEVYQGNNSSCVVKITGPKGAILLTGDIEKSREQWLLAQGVRLHATIVVAPHHGSISSSSARFVQAVSPQAVLFPVGYYNRYNFPSHRVVARYRAVGARVFTSAQDGAIVAHIDAHGDIDIATANDKHYFWQD